MFKTKKEVDAHVRTALSKIRSEAERHLRSLTIAKLYFKINEYATAEQYLTSYLSVKEDNDQAHKLLGQCYQRLKKPDKALQAFQVSLQLNPKQSDVLVEVCQLLLEDKNFNSNKAKYWCELAESEKVQHEAVFSLRLKLMNKDHLGTNQVEDLIQKEIAARPNDVQLRVRLVRNYVEKNQILDAFKYVHQLEMSHKDEFATNGEWYNIVWLVLNKYEQIPSTKKDWDFWLLVAICLERQVQISFSSTSSSNIVGGGVTETANLLFKLDQYLFKITQLSDNFCAQKELVQLFLDHYRGQLLLHASALIFKRELLQNKNKWKETTRLVLPLLLLGYQIEARENKEPWMKHCDEQSKQLLGLWQREGSFRCAQMGRVLLSCINDDPSVDKENAHNINYLLDSQNGSLWQSNDELLAQVRQSCSDRQWRHNIFALLFCNSDQKVKEQCSLFAKSSKLNEPVYEMPSYADVERYEDAAQYLRPQSLQHMVYLCLGNDNLAYVKAKYFSGLNFSTHNLSFCGAESLNQLDVDSFLYAATIQAKRAIEVDREAFLNYQAGNSTAAGKPKLLPFANIQNILCTEEQFQWWNSAYMVYKNLSNGNNLAEIRANLQYGIEAVRGINGPKLDMAIVFKLGQLFVARAQDIVKPIEKTFLESRAESLYKHGLNMMRMHNKGVLEPFRKYFKYSKSQSSAAERELTSAAEDAVSYLATRYFKKAEYEDLIEELSGIQLPFATYLQAEAYRKLDEASKTPKKTKRMYLDRASECLNQTLTLLKSSAHADPNHPLNSVIHSEIKRLQQASARYLNESNTTYSPLSAHNNSSTYEDAEADLYAENSAIPPAALINSIRPRRENLSNTTALLSTHTQEMENIVKQITETLKLELGNVTKEISTLKDKISNLEEAVKKISVASNSPSRDDASNVLDDLYLIEDTLQQQLYQHQQQSSATPHINAPQYGNNAGNVTNGPNMLPNSPFIAQHQRLQAAAAFNSPMFPPAHNYPMNFYGHPNQPNPYIMTQQPIAPPINQRPGTIPSLTYLDPNVPVPQAGINFNMPATSASLLPPPAQPAPALGEPPKPNNLYNLLQQITPNINNQIPPPTMPIYSTSLTHTSITMPLPVTNTTSMNITTGTNIMPINKQSNSQVVEKGPPANVVITSSDPLPNPNTIAVQSQQQPPLSVTIPSHHIKPSLGSQPPPPLEKAPLTNKPMISTHPTSSFNTFGTSIATSTFSFKPQIAAAAAQSNNTLVSGTPIATENHDETSESLGTDFNRSGTEEEYDPRPDFKGIITLPDEVEVRTGEEDEEVMFCHRAKLFRYVDKEWKERGIGHIKILKNKEGKSRILMRRDHTHKICANHIITPEMTLTEPKNETKGFIWGANDFADETLQVEKFFVRFKLLKTAKQFEEAFINAQNEARNKDNDAGSIKKGEEKPKEVTFNTKSNSAAPFSLAKSNVTTFVTSTPAQKSETAFSGVDKNVFGQALTSAPNTTASSTITTPASKSLFSGSSLSTKTFTQNETTNKSIPSTTSTTTAPSPFANFTFGKPSAPSNISTATTVTQAANNAKASTTTSSPFASIFSNLSTSSFTSTTTAATAAFIPTTVNEIVSTSSINKSTVSDNEDDYVPTAQFNPVIPLPDLVEVNTGEENEIVLFEHRAKLLRFDKEAGEWKERGLGNIKLLQDKNDVNKLRLVMRREQIHKLCCNQRVYKDTSFKYAKNSTTALSWAGQDFSENELVTEMLTIRFKLPETCKDFLEAIQQAQAKMNVDGEEANSKANEKNEKSAEIKATKGFGDAFKPKAGAWSCEACYISNDADKLYCVACDSPKDSTVPKKEANSNILANNSTTKFNFGFGAYPAATANVEKTSGTTTKPTFEFGTTTAKSATTNDATKKNEAALPHGGGFGDTFKPKAGSWTCQSCYLSNTAEAVYCKACDAPKDDTVPKKDSNTNIFIPSDTAQNFKFGFSSPATSTPKTNESSAPPKSSQATIGFGDAFKPKAGSWTCQGCYLSNTADKVYCTACDAPKDDTVPKKEPNANILAISNPSQKFNFGFDSSATAAATAPIDNSNKTIGSGFSFSAVPVTASDSAKSFTFTPPSATSTILNTNLINATTSSISIGKPTFSFSLSSKSMESPATISGTEETPISNAFSLDKKEFSFTLKPKSPGKTGKSPMKLGGGDADVAGEDEVETDFHEDEENNTYFTPVIPLPDKIEVKTGEEDEEILYIHRAKLFRFVDSEWKERGLGNVKILRHKENKKLRVVMRREQILKICLNHVLNESVDYTRKDDKSWMFVVNDFSEGAVELEKFSLRFKTKEIAEDFMETIKKALDGTAKAIEVQGNSSIVTPSNMQTLPVNILDISEDDKKTADKLKLPYEFFTSKTTCSGCRGCDPDKFVFADLKNTEPFVNKDDTENQLVIMELPALTINKPATNRSFLKQSVLSPANLKTDSSKLNEGIFSGFGGANSTAFASTTTAEQNPANTTFSFTAALNSSTKPPAEENKIFGTAGSGGFLFGSAATIGSANTGGSIFGQKPAIFGGAVTSNNTFTKPNESTDKTATTKSIFGGSSSASTGPIFGGKAVFGNTAPAFGTSSINDTNKSIFGASGGGNSIFGSSKNTSSFGSNESQAPIFGSLAKDVNTSNTSFGDLSKTSTAAVNFASDKSQPTFADLAKSPTASLDFASVAKANSNTTSFAQKPNEKPGPGGFIGLTHQDDFSSFQNPQKELDISGKNASKTETNETQKSSGDGEEDDDKNNENYDPHYDPIIELPEEIVVSTGEEDEIKLFGERSSLYRWDDTVKQWKERGIGELKILYHPVKKSYRLVMRREQVLKLVLNHGINGDFKFKNMDKCLDRFVWASINYAESNEGQLEKLAVRFKKLDVAEKFSKKLNEAIEDCKKREAN